MALIPKAAFTNKRIETWYTITTPLSYEDRKKLMDYLNNQIRDHKYSEDIEAYYWGDIYEKDFILYFKTTRPSFRELIAQDYTVIMVDIPKRELERFI